MGVPVMSCDRKRVSTCIMDLIDEAGILSGYTALKDEQKMAVQGFLDSSDVFIVLPTGFGKTACFACLPHAFDLNHGRSL